MIVPAHVKEYPGHYDTLLILLFLDWHLFLAKSLVLFFIVTKGDQYFGPFTIISHGQIALIGHFLSDRFCHSLDLCFH